jgi:hypothetical protein
VLLPQWKLHFLEQQTVILRSLPRGEIGNQLLRYVVFEDCVKKRFLQYIRILDEQLQGHLTDSKLLKTSYNLLTNKREQELFLINIMLNRLGVQKRGCTSKSGFLLLCFVMKHPLSSIIIASNVESI